MHCTHAHAVLCCVITTTGWNIPLHVTNRGAQAPLQAGATWHYIASTPASPALLLAGVKSTIRQALTATAAKRHANCVVPVTCPCQRKNRTWSCCTAPICNRVVHDMKNSQHVQVKHAHSYAHYGTLILYQQAQNCSGNFPGSSSICTEQVCWPLQKRLFSAKYGCNTNRQITGHKLYMFQVKTLSIFPFHKPSKPH